MHESPLSRIVSVAPMMDYTDRHCRYLLRAISQHALLYTEMVTTGAILNGDRSRLLNFHAAEHPLALQLGGSDPKELALCSSLGQDFGYDEINLNIGCPSNRVQTGRFGACLMAEPELVAECVAAMKAAVSIPVTVKTRIGIDQQDSYEHLCNFVGRVAEAGCNTFIIHARKAVLGGLSPKQNREIPPLRYDIVYQLKREFPQLEIVINGGIQNLDDAKQHLQKVDGVMLGRAAYHNPYLLAGVDSQFYLDPDPAPTRAEILGTLVPYIEEQMGDGVRLGHIARHLLGLFQGQPGARAWRRSLSQGMHREGAGLEIIENASRSVLPAGRRTMQSGAG